MSKLSGCLYVVGTFSSRIDGEIRNLLQVMEVNGSDDYLSEQWRSKKPLQWGGQDSFIVTSSGEEEEIESRKSGHLGLRTLLSLDRQLKCSESKAGEAGEAGGAEEKVKKNCCLGIP